MNPFETSVALDPNASLSVLNMTTGGKKGGQSDGIPIPIGLQPSSVQNLVRSFSNRYQYSFQFNFSPVLVTKKITRPPDPTSTSF